jgi:GrpB-like predicted nucleotidyltransferase (UPF0157 family)
MTVTLVQKYNPSWPRWFEDIKTFLGAPIVTSCLCIEHVGSTSIPGMTAKPIIDLILVIEPERWEQMKSLLEERGYYYRGDQGIADREVFRLKDDAVNKSLPEHHLYVCPKHSFEIKRETAFRDYLKRHPDEAAELSVLKWSLSERFSNDRQAYMDGKDAMCKEITKKALKYFPG